jgi:hypothetical protein
LGCTNTLAVSRQAGVKRILNRRCRSWGAGNNSARLGPGARAGRSIYGAVMPVELFRTVAASPDLQTWYL